MNYRLINQKDSSRILCLTNRTWYAILELAWIYGWNPIGTVLPEAMIGYANYPAGHEFQDANSFIGGYAEDETRQVMLEDALNLADALDQAFLEYEPEWTWHYEHEYTPFGGVINRAHPSIGAIMETVAFCRTGSFHIERF